MKKTVRKNIILALTLAFMIHCLAGLGVLEVTATTEMELVQTAVSHLKEDVDALQTAIETKAETATVNKKIAELESSIANAEATAKIYSDTQNNALKGELEAAIASAKAELAEAINKKADAEKVTELEAEIAGLESKVDTLNTELDNAMKETAELKAKSSKLQTVTLIVCFISVTSLGVCCALAIYVIKNIKNAK